MPNSKGAAALSIPQEQFAVSPALRAALLLAARDELVALQLPAPPIQQILERTGAGRSRSYELKLRLVESLPQLCRRPGRPRSREAGVEPSSEAAEVRLEMLRFERRHPGSMRAGPGRGWHSDLFRHHVLSLRQQHAGLELVDFARAIDIPLGTVKGWLASSKGDSEVEQPGPVEVAPDVSMDTQERSLHIQQVLLEWQGWGGGLAAFCTHIKEHCRIPLGRAAICSILEAHGVRLRQRRPGRSPDEEALRDSFQTFFAGAQWAEDGKSVTVTLGGEHFTFNFELVVDAATGALTGATISDAEDALAVVDTFESGIATTGASPLSLLVDSRPSNHAPEVDVVLEDSTMKIRATPARPQNKAHVEGAFGLFSQTIPPLIITATTPRETARQILQLAVEIWARIMNHRPRRDRNNRSRFELYRDDTPTLEQIEAARSELAERMRRQELVRQTLLAKQDPVTLQLIDEALCRLELSDPGDHFRAAMARHGRDAVVEGIAIFSTKRELGTLPSEVDVRYLLGIIANVAHDNELCALTEHLIDERIHARDVALSQLIDERDTVEHAQPTLLAHVEHHVDQACASSRKLDRLFWLRATAQSIVAAQLTDDERASWLRFASARIHAAATQLSQRERLDAMRFLTRQVLPIT